MLISSRDATLVFSPAVTDVLCHSSSKKSVPKISDPAMRSLVEIRLCAESGNVFCRNRDKSRGPKRSLFSFAAILSFRRVPPSEDEDDDEYEDRSIYLLLNRTFLACGPLRYLGWGRQLRYIPTAAEGFNQRYGAGHL
jgi:hypothetical protein